VVAVIAALLLLGVLGGSMLANTAGRRGDRIACVNNLRQIGRGFLEWGQEHDGVFTSWRPLNQGTLPFYPTLWFQFFTLSNELRTPRILADPGDNLYRLRMAITWTDSPAGGLLHPSYRNNAISYFLGEHASQMYPQEILSGDRNMLTSGPVQTAPGLWMWTVDQRNTAWTNDVHGSTGNLLFSDGHVEQTDTTRLRSAAGFNNHFLFPY
jgi:prepilin-type processing-associated H-X9-DG protein